MTEIKLTKKDYDAIINNMGIELSIAKEIISSMLNAMKLLGVYRTQGGIMDKAEAFLKE